MMVPSEARPADRVLLLHGILRSAASMSRLDLGLVAAGYRTLNLDYPARRMPLQALADEVHRSAGAFLGGSAGRTHIVTHSLGGLVARVLITRHRPPGLGRVVMLGPPNAGSELADRLAGLAPYRWAFGPAGRQLVTRQDDALRQQFGEVDYALGIIAGTRSVDPLGWMLIPKPNDGRVSVARTRVVGMTDHMTLPVTHALMMRSPAVIRQTMSFLEHGHFMATRR